MNTCVVASCHAKKKKYIITYQNNTLSKFNISRQCIANNF